MREFLKNYDYLLRLKFIGAALILFTLLSYLATVHRYFEMINCFIVYYFYILLVIALTFFIKKQWFWGTVFFVFAILNLSKFVYLYFAPEQAQIDHSDKILVLNVFTANQQHSKVIELIKQENPDHITLTEVNERWSFEITKALSSTYPNILSVPRRDNFGIMFLSKRSFEGEEIYVDEIPALKAKFKDFTVISVHPLPPISKSYFKRRNEFLAEIKNWTANIDSLILCGDFNAVSWSPFFKEMQDENNLRLCSQGFGINTSWPTNIPFLRIPIDHCLISKNGTALTFKRGPSVGSDHFPLVTEFGFSIEKDSNHREHKEHRVKEL